MSAVQKIEKKACSEKKQGIDITFESARFSDIATVWEISDVNLRRVISFANEGTSADGFSNKSYSNLVRANHFRHEFCPDFASFAVLG